MMLLHAYRILAYWIDPMSFCYDPDMRYHIHQRFFMQANFEELISMLKGA